MVLLLGYGFLGQAIYKSLKEEGLKVRVLSRNFPFSNEDFINSDFNSISNIEHAFKEVKTVIHCFHSTVPFTSINNEIFDVQTNLIPFISILNLCKKYEIENFIYISSGGAVYGNPLNAIPVEENFPTNPISSYGITKLSCEKYLLMSKDFFKGNCVVLRPSNIYGPGQNTNKPQGIIGHLIKSAREKTKIEIWGDGNGKKDYLHIDDFTEGLIKVINNNFKLNTNIYNISSEISYSINDLIKLVEKRFHYKLNIIRKKENLYDVKNILLSNKLFSKTFDWKSKIKLENYIEII
jgi:UDP-glucose 4-epimerase